MTLTVDCGLNFRSYLELGVQAFGRVRRYKARVKGLVLRCSKISSVASTLESLNPRTLEPFSAI